LVFAMASALRAHRAVTELVLARGVHEERGCDCTDGVAGIDDAPVARDAAEADAPVGPRHDDQVVAREELRAACDDQQQAEAEDHSGSEPGEPERYVAGARGHDGGEHGAERDERAGQHRQHERAGGVEARLRDPEVGCPCGHRRRQWRVDGAGWDRMWSVVAVGGLGSRRGRHG